MIPLPRLLDNNGNEIRRIRPERVSISEDIVPVSTASIRLSQGDTIPYRSYVELFNANGSAGVYRAKMPAVSYNGRRDVVDLEHAIAEVGDYLVKGNIEQDYKSLSQAVTQVFEHYSGSKWQLGTISVDTNVVISANYSNILQTINSLIEQVPGAMMTFDFSTSPWTFNIGYMEQSVSAEGRLSRNIESVEISRNDSELCTRVWLKHLSATESQSYMDADTISTYGVIEKVLTDRNYTTQQAQQVATRYLSQHKHPVYSVSIDGVDFSSVTGETLDRVKIGKLYRLTIPEDLVVIEEPIISIEWPDVYDEPNYIRLVFSQPDIT